MEYKIMKTKIKLGESVRREIYNSVYVSVNHSVYYPLRDAIPDSAWESIWYGASRPIQEPINTSTRWVIAL